MAIQSSFYSVDGKTKTFPSTKHIATKQHMAVWLRHSVTGVDVQLNTEMFELITNAAVLTEAPSIALYDRIEVRVADVPDELGSSPSDIGVVADIGAEVAIVAGISAEVVVVAGHDAEVEVVGQDLLKGAGTNQPTDSAILNALNNANMAILKANEASASANQSELDMWDSEVSSMNAEEWANAPHNVFVKIFVSDGDGTFSYTDSTDYSSHHWKEEAKAIANFSLDGLSDVTITNPTIGESLVYNDQNGEWENGKVLGLPNETGNLGKSVTTDGVEGDSFWSFVNTNPNVMNADQVMTAGTSASVVDGFTINDNITLTVPDGSVLSVV